MNNIQEIVIIPEKVNAMPGKEVILACKGINDLEKQVDVVGVFWDCTGGTISDSGVFVAGDLCGEFCVRASLKTPDGSFKKSAPVTISRETTHISRPEKVAKADFPKLEKKEEKPQLSFNLEKQIQAKNPTSEFHKHSADELPEIKELPEDDIKKIIEKKKYKHHGIGATTRAVHRVLENNRDIERLVILVILCMLLGCSIMANCYGYSLEKINATIKTITSLLESFFILFLLIMAVIICGIRYFYTKPGILREKLTKQVNDPGKKIDDYGFTRNENSA